MPPSLALEAVEAPPLRPPTSGLVATLRSLNLLVEHGPESEHWLGGIRLAPALVGALESIEVCGAMALDDGGTQSAARDYFAFALYARDEGSTLCVASPDRARESLLAKESAAVEEEFEQALLISTNPHLAETTDPTTTIVPSGDSTTAPDFSPAGALALLEKAIGDARIGQGLIHVPPIVAPRLPGITIDSETGIRYTAAGTPLIIGGGYMGIPPDGTAETDSSAWMYATDMIVLHRSREVTVSSSRAEAIDRQNNIASFWAMRAYAIAWSGLLRAAVHVEPPT